MTPGTPRDGQAKVGPLTPYRYTVICWDDNCPDALDTYGGEEVLEMARAHVAQHGHALDVQVKATIKVEPS